MSWYYNITTGNIVELTGTLKFFQDREIGLEEHAAQLGAPQFNFGPFPTQADAQAFKTAHPSAVDQAKGAVQGVAGDVSGAVANFGNQLVKLSIRFAEAAVGVVLLAIALNVILKQATGVDVAGSAVKAGKTAAAVGVKAAAVA
jgi:hypothetical protein